MRVAKIDNPAATDTDYSANIVRQVCDLLTRTGADNVTRPWLLEKWTPSDDLKTWTLYLKKGIKWSNGDELTADHVVWNLSRWFDEKTGSSIIGLFSSFLMVSYDTGKKDSAGKAVMGTKLWSDSAIEKVDDYTIRLNGQTADAGRAGEPVPLHRARSCIPARTASSASVRSGPAPSPSRASSWARRRS